MTAQPLDLTEATRVLVRGENRREIAEPDGAGATSAGQTDAAVL
jgi:hypothetical protein